MFSKTLVAVALASTAFAQLDTKCDPLKTCKFTHKNKSLDERKNESQC